MKAIRFEIRNYSGREIDDWVKHTKQETNSKLTPKAIPIEAEIVQTAENVYCAKRPIHGVKENRKNKTSCHAGKKHSAKSLRQLPDSAFQRRIGREDGRISISRCWVRKNQINSRN
jgi:hypothetical protein